MPYHSDKESYKFTMVKNVHPRTRHEGPESD